MVEILFIAVRGIASCRLSKKQLCIYSTCKHQTRADGFSYIEERGETTPPQAGMLPKEVRSNDGICCERLDLDACVLSALGRYGRHLLRCCFRPQESRRDSHAKVSRC